jgi:hypothetical protein
MMNLTKLLVPSLVASCLAACGGGQPAQDPSSSDVQSEVEAAPSAEADGNADTAEAPAVKWSEMTRDQRMEFMGLTIMPEMKKVFQAADPVGYKEFTCQTCHGKDAQQVDFKMPNGLFALAKPDPIPAATEYDAKVTKFMMDDVVPKMATLMGMEAGKEMNCFSCHESE